MGALQNPLLTPEPPFNKCQMRNRMPYILAAVIAAMLVLGAYFFDISGSGVEAPGSDQVARAAMQVSVDLEANDDGETGEAIGPDPDAITPLMHAGLVQWRKRPVEDGVWEDYLSIPYIELRRLAESGDSRAAAWLSHYLSNCRFFPAPQSDFEINAAVEEMRRTHLIPAYFDGGARMQDFNNYLDSLEANIEVYEQRAKACRHVPIEHRGEWEDWASRAFASGYTDDLVHTQFESDLDSADYTQMLNDLWVSGEPTALVSLWLASTREYIKGSAPHAQIESLAYLMTAQRLLKDYIAKLDVSPDASLMSSELSRGIEHLRNVLLPGEIAEAEEISNRLIDENGNCCLAWPSHYFSTN